VSQAALELTGSSARAHSSPPRAAQRSASPYVAAWWYDWLFFLAPPLLGLLLGGVIGALDIAHERFWLDGRRVTYVGLGIGALVNAHLVAVLFRSHGSPGIFKRHPIRFVVVPPLLVVIIASSAPVMLVTTVVIVFWDAYHSALQTFGFARMYDRRAGNDPALGRRLDLGLNLLLYLGPIVAGASMLAHFEKLVELEELGITFLASVPTFLHAEQRAIGWIIAAAGATFVGCYLVAYARLARRGYRVSWPKVFLLSTTGLCSIVTWGFNPWGLAFLMMNFFHAVQYLALVWWSEGARVRDRLRLGRLAAVAFIVFVFAYGAWADLVTPDEPYFWAIVQTVALLHFWYDGFIWSVTKRDV